MQLNGKNSDTDTDTVFKNMSTLILDTLKRIYHDTFIMCHDN